jgi:hypothetical protein
MGVTAGDSTIASGPDECGSTRVYPRVSKSQGILDRLLNLPNAAFVSVESACLAQ